MNYLEIAFLCVYFGILAVLSAYGSQRFRMTFLYYRHKYKVTKPSGMVGAWPKVTVQLPVYNELFVVERLIDGICQLDYPKDRYEIQILDDSTDETARIAASKVAEWRARGIDVSYVRRADRTGFKAGALANGLRGATGDFIAVFDADFVPSKDFLKRTIPYFGTDDIGMVQTRWGHLNRDANALTRAQSILLDGHFIIEHTARNRSGAFFNFNGTAGVWRRKAIEDAGGWQHDTLTEDLDLSYRSQLKGWRFLFLPDVVSPAEIPSDMNSYKLQQHRWAKGSIQTAKKLLPLIFKSDLPFSVKREAFFHLTNNIAYLLMVVMSVMMPMAMVLRIKREMYTTLLLDLPIFVASTGSVALFYVATSRELGFGWWERVKYLPVVLALGSGMAINQCKAVIEALFDWKSDFARTPKRGTASTTTSVTRYLGKRSWLPWLEIAFGAYFSWGIYYAASLGLWASVPFLFLFQGGFLYVGLSSLFASGIRLSRVVSDAGMRIESLVPRLPPPVRSTKRSR